MPTPRRHFLPLSIAIALTLALPATATAYTKPPGGKWNIQNIFDNTYGGGMKLSKDGSTLTTLVLNVGADYSEDCGSKVRLESKPTIKKFPTAGGRYAFGRQLKGSTLIKPIGVTFKSGGKAVKGTLLMLFDHSGRLANTGELTFGDCSLDFAARKPR